MHYLIYQITNIVNSKVYIGKHRTSNIDDGYMGSGTILKRAIAKHGISNFRREILHECDSEELLNDLEAQIVNRDFITRPDTYNIMLGGHGGRYTLNTNSIPYECCNQIFSNKNAYANHIRHTHKRVGIAKVNCQYCDRYIAIHKMKKHCTLCIENPTNFKYCKHCNVRIRQYLKTFCNSSCSTTFNNLRRKIESTSA
jgi:hypothetical protein